MTDIVDRITAIREMQEQAQQETLQDPEDIAAAGDKLRSALEQEQAKLGLSGAEVDPATGIGGNSGGVSQADLDEARIDRGESTIRSQDATYQSTEWDRASGRADDGLTDLYDG